MAEQANGVAYEPEALDATERRFWRECWESVPADVAAKRGIELREFGPIQASVVAALPEVRMLNLVLGAGEADAAKEGHLSAALDWVESRGVDCYVPLKPGAPGGSATKGLLEQRGYELGYAWMKFVREPSPSDLPEAAGVEVVELSKGEGEDFGQIAAAGFDLPPWAGIFFSDLPGREGWRCYEARIDGGPRGCAALLINDGVAEFGIAATLESARGRGCQTALLRRRIDDAIAAGCHTLFVETGERTTDRPSASYRNILKAGFKEAYLRPNWRHSA